MGGLFLGMWLGILWFRGLVVVSTCSLRTLSALAAASHARSARGAAPWTAFSSVPSPASVARISLRDLWTENVAFIVEIVGMFALS